MPAALPDWFSAERYPLAIAAADWSQKRSGW